jgi:hypothetical protein
LPCRHEFAEPAAGRRLSPPPINDAVIAEIGRQRRRRISDPRGPTTRPVARGLSVRHPADANRGDKPGAIELTPHRKEQRIAEFSGPSAPHHPADGLDNE